MASTTTRETSSTRCSGERLEDLPRDAWGGGCGVRTWSEAGIFGNGGAGGMGTKSDCHMGSFVAGGLLNAMRGWCHCSGVWRGSITFAPRGPLEGGSATPDERLTKGPAFDSEPDPRFCNLQPADWPVYRHDNQRTAGSPVAVAEPTPTLWRHEPELPYTYVAERTRMPCARQDQPTEPVAAGGLIFSGGSDGKVEALESRSGRTVWTYWTGGRVYAPPTVWEGRVYVGSCDGYVYCLDAASGQLAWRFLAAPYGERIMRPVTWSAVGPFKAACSSTRAWRIASVDWLTSKAFTSGLDAQLWRGSLAQCNRRRRWRRSESRPDARWLHDRDRFASVCAAATGPRCSLRPGHRPQRNASRLPALLAGFGTNKRFDPLGPARLPCLATAYSSKGAGAFNTS